MREEKKSLSDRIHFYISKWKYFAVSIVACLILGGLISYIKSPIYEIDANVLITDNDTQSDFLRSFSMADMFGGKASADEELLLISSYSLFNDVVKQYDINKVYIIKKNLLKRIRAYEDTPVKIECDNSIPDTLSSQLIFKVKINDKGLAKITGKDKNGTFIEIKDKHLPLSLSTIYGKFRFDTTEYYDKDESLNIAILLESYAAATEKLQKLIECYIPSRKANVITVSMKCTDKDYAKKIVNTIVDEYNLRGIEDTRNRNQITAGFIDVRLNEIANELNSTEIAVENYKNDNNIIDLVADAQYIFTKKGTIDEALVTAETEYEILEMTRELMNDPAHRYQLIPTPYGAEAAVAAIEEYNKLVLERMKLENNAKTNNNAALRTISGQLDAMRENINATLDRSLASARVKLHDLREQMNESDTRLGKLPRQEREFLNIKRQQIVKENLYLFLLKQREETSLRIANSIPKGTIIDKAYALTKPINMGPAMILFIALVFGVMLPIAFFYIKDALKSKIISKKDIEKITDTPIIGEISNLPKNSLIINDTQHESIQRQLKSLCANIQFLTNSNKKVIALTSLQDGDGKSFIAVNLANRFAQQGKKVVLVELDMCNCTIADMLNVSTSKELSHYLYSDDVKVNDVITKVNIGNNSFDAIIAGETPTNYAPIASERVESLLDELRKTYDYIIIDGFSIKNDNDAIILSKICDMILFVCRSKHTSINNVKKINSIRKISEFKKIGIIANGTTHYKSLEKQ
ncbi:MAG: P-loop NTPase [Muribaculum sp.]|nr:P-loop NTPase [Muribaculum sp.]